ncbi:hypothetical protein WN944_027965 [Citrus x changshan-huyou]|uniref:Uncharacterized protein n=1 Tax=Citrus x changshan-huyou TaxID=2935761 RepID=A0AAP0QAC8_9ROSI
MGASLIQSLSPGLKGVLCSFIALCLLAEPAFGITRHYEFDGRAAFTTSPLLAEEANSGGMHTYRNCDQHSPIIILPKRDTPNPFAEPYKEVPSSLVNFNHR